MVANKTQAPKGRRYVGPAETAGFIMFDAATRVRVQANEEFTDRILNIDKGMQALVGPIMTAWDIVNDLFVAAFVDRTRTRFGKFRPYLILYPLFGLPLELLMFILPYFFSGASATFVPKIIAWAAVKMLMELTRGTIFEICRTGMIANITPEPQERLSLLTKANLLSIGSSLPEQIFGIMRDVISRSTSKWTPVVINLKMRNLFFGFGIVTAIIAAGLSLYFAMVSRQRVFGAETAKEKPPTIRESIAALRHNRPLLMLMLAEILNGFNIKSQLGTYTNSILNFANFGLVSGIAGGPISYIGYAYVTKLRQRFSTKALWIASENISKPVIIAIFFFGMIKVKNPAKRAKGVTRMFMDLIPMLIAYAVEDMVAMTLYGCKRVIPDEIRNECIDYGEWKNGFRSEGMVGVLRGMPAKITNMFGSSMTSLIMKLIGFKTGVDYNKQSEKTAIGVFAMATLIPTITGFIALIPKFFFNISQKDRERMYPELAERRAAAAASVSQLAEDAR